MTTYTIPGFTINTSGTEDAPIFAVEYVSLSIVVPDATVGFTYEILFDWGDGADVVSNVELYDFQVDGVSINTIATEGFEEYSSSISWNGSGGAAYTYSLWDTASDVDYVFQLGGVTLPDFSAPGALNDFLDTTPVESTTLSGTGFGPGDVILFASLPGVVVTEDDNFFGTIFADTLDGGIGNDVINGLDGDDLVIGRGGRDILNGGGGNDILIGGTNNDVLLGSNGNDVLNGGAGNDIMNGGAGNDRIVDQIGNNRMSGRDGDDVMIGGAGKNVMMGGRGSDTMLDGSGDATMFGGVDSDRMIGGEGNDRLYGSYGNDTLNGGGGIDRISGDQGNDYMLGGAGADIFILRAGNGTDRIADFENDVDRLFIESALTGGSTDAATVVSTYASVVAGDVVFDFGGGNTLSLIGVSSTADLADDLVFI